MVYLTKKALLILFLFIFLQVSPNQSELMYKHLLHRKKALSVVIY